MSRKERQPLLRPNTNSYASIPNLFAYNNKALSPQNIVLEPKELHHPVAASLEEQVNYYYSTIQFLTNSKVQQFHIWKKENGDVQ